MCCVVSSCSPEHCFSALVPNYLSPSDLGITYYVPCNSLLIPVPLAQDALCVYIAHEHAAGITFWVPK